MQNGQKTMTSTHRPKSARPFANRSKQWTSNGARPDLRGHQNAQKNYERYLALASFCRKSQDSRVDPAFFEFSTGAIFALLFLIDCMCVLCHT